MDLKSETVKSETLHAGFAAVRVLSPFIPEQRGRNKAPSLLVCALPYPEQPEQPEHGCLIAPFAQRNYYREAVLRLQKLARIFRNAWGGKPSHYQILCNSPIAEKPLAVACGLGVMGKNDLVITREVGSRCIIAAMTLPFDMPSDRCDDSFKPCARCAACIQQCPTGALTIEGVFKRLRCIQWYASGHEKTVPEYVARVWGRRLYGCTECQDCCPWNMDHTVGIESSLGILPPSIDGDMLLNMEDEAIKQFFKGTVLGHAWIGPQTIRRNVQLSQSWMNHYHVSPVS